MHVSQTKTQNIGNGHLPLQSTVVLHNFPPVDLDSTLDMISSRLQTTRMTLYHSKLHNPGAYDNYDAGFRCGTSTGREKERSECEDAKSESAITSLIAAIADLVRTREAGTRALVRLVAAEAVSITLAPFLGRLIVAIFVTKSLALKVKDRRKFLLNFGLTVRWEIQCTTVLGGTVWSAALCKPAQ